jgi:hypothetical protein
MTRSSVRPRQLVLQAPYEPGQELIRHADDGVTYTERAG